MVTLDAWISKPQIVRQERDRAKDFNIKHNRKYKVTFEKLEKVYSFDGDDVIIHEILDDAPQKIIDAILTSVDSRRGVTDENIMTITIDDATLKLMGEHIRSRQEEYLAGMTIEAEPPSWLDKAMKEFPGYRFIPVKMSEDSEYACIRFVRVIGYTPGVKYSKKKIEEMVKRSEEVYHGNE